MTQNEFEQLFRNKATASVDDGVNAREAGNNAQKGNINHIKRKVGTDNSFNRTASQLAEACEHFMKAPIIYYDFSKSKIILNASQEKYDDIIEFYLKSPEKIQTSIISGDDSRKRILLTSNSSSRDIHTSGHDIYAYYKLQNPILTALINHEFITNDGEDEFNWINFGILTHDYLEYDPDGTLQMTSAITDLLYKNKDRFPTSRYTATNGGDKRATDEDIEFLFELSGGLEKIMCILFPDNDNYKLNSETRLEKELGTKILKYRMPGSINKTFLNLDMISSFNLKNEFSKQEFELLLEQLAKINNNPTIPNENKSLFRSVYTNLCVYLKHCTCEVGADIFFDSKVFERIEKYCRIVMKNDLFDKNSTQLKKHKFFINHKLELQKELQEQIQKTQLKKENENKKNEEIAASSNPNNLDHSKREQELINYININHKLPLNWKEHFEDGGDMRLWFDSIYHLDKFKDYNQELNELFEKYNIHVLTPLEKEYEFREYVSRRRQIPRVHEFAFSDNSDMGIWYLTYKDEHEEFETSIQKSLPIYQDLDLAEIWPDCKYEFQAIIISQGRIPRYGEYKINGSGIDVRTIYDKLVNFDPDYSERLLLHLETHHNPHCLSKEDRYLEYKTAVTTLGYEPDLQELRFSDGTDMFTWITKYRTEEFQKEIDSITNPKPEKEVNNCYIPEFRKTGGKFYTICTNYGERLDLTGINSFEEAKKLDPTIKKSGGLILKKKDGYKKS